MIGRSRPAMGAGERCDEASSEAPQNCVGAGSGMRLALLSWSRLRKKSRFSRNPKFHDKYPPSFHRFLRHLVPRNREFDNNIEQGWGVGIKSAVLTARAWLFALLIGPPFSKVA